MQITWCTCDVEVKSKRKIKTTLLRKKLQNCIYNLVDTSKRNNESERISLKLGKVFGTGPNGNWEWKLQYEKNCFLYME